MNRDRPFVAVHLLRAIDPVIVPFGGQAMDTGVGYVVASCPAGRFCPLSLRVITSEKPGLDDNGAASTRHRRRNASRNAAYPHPFHF